MSGLTLRSDTNAYIPPERVPIDCARYPGDSVSTVVDTFGQAETDIGDAAAGSAKWREHVTVVARGAGEFALLADGFGPVLSYDGVASGELDGSSLSSAVTGSKVTVALPPPGAAAVPGSVQVTFNCGPNSGQ